MWNLVVWVLVRGRDFVVGWRRRIVFVVMRRLVSWRIGWGIKRGKRGWWVRRGMRIERRRRRRLVWERMLVFVEGRLVKGGNGRGKGGNKLR